MTKLVIKRENQKEMSFTLIDTAKPNYLCKFVILEDFKKSIVIIGNGNQYSITVFPKSILIPEMAYFFIADELEFINLSEQDLKNMQLDVNEKNIIKGGLK
ncbi:MAG TPA: hypothetical protein PKV92_08990 [Thermodesulfovibrio thiophilus]|nr:hypothetical protein [Thermodesulfovibrio thiophilus]HQD37213.1 hypothetical protein [Thermodesulfovibrio thiophilus]